MSKIKFSINIDDIFNHIIKVTLDIKHPKKDQAFSLPVWIPGSYLIREFAQHIISIEVYGDEKKVSFNKINKNTIQVLGSYKNIRVEYKIYALDSSIRAAYLDDKQCFFNGSSLFMWPHESLNEEYLVHIEKPKNAKQSLWEVSTTMPQVKIDNNGFGDYKATNYADLIDYPMQISTMKRLKFTAHNLPHEIVLVGDVRAFDEKKLIDDLKKLCETIIDFFLGKAPFDKYLFIARFEENGHGGLEHQNSSMLLANPYSLPKENIKEAEGHYRNFLSLAAHEYFHAWNVKSIRPQNFVSYDLNQEVYTTMLWAFEGITSYYDDLFLKKAGLISDENYLDILSKNINNYYLVDGRKLQSLADSSFDAWIKFYRPHDNSPNFQVSYYQKGALLALALDLSIQKENEGKKSLDDVMRAIYEHYGNKQGITEDQWIKLASKITNFNVKNFIDRYVYTTEELPILDLLKDIGVTYVEEEITDKARALLGLKYAFDNRSKALVSLVALDGPAAKAGITPSDEIIALNNIRLEEKNHHDLIGGVLDLKEVEVLYARKKQIFKTLIKPNKSYKKPIKLVKG